MENANTNDKTANLPTIFAEITRIRQMAEESKLDLLAYMLRTAECEVMELLLKDRAIRKVRSN